MIDSNESWRTLFENWPAAMPRQGLIVTKQNEAIPFLDFLYSRSIVLLDRGKPDAMGARKVAVAFDQIATLKFAGAEELASFQPMGFKSPIQ